MEGLIHGRAYFRILRYYDYSLIKEGVRLLRYKSFCCIMKSFRCITKLIPFIIRVESLQRHIFIESTLRAFFLPVREASVFHR